MIQREMMMEKVDDSAELLNEVVDSRKFVFQQKFESRWFSWVQQAAVTAGGE